MKKETIKVARASKNFIYPSEGFRAKLITDEKVEQVFVAVGFICDLLTSGEEYFKKFEIQNMRVMIKNGAEHRIYNLSHLDIHNGTLDMMVKKNDN